MNMKGNNGRDKPTFGDDSFTGTGKIKCALCGEPLRDHELTETCTVLAPGDRLTVPTGRPRKRKRRDDHGTQNI